MKLFSFRETSDFTKGVQRYLSEDSYAALQRHLIRFPDIGDIISGGGGIRKIRWQAAGRGKRGGTRIIYYWAVSKDYIYMLDIYPKNEKKDLTHDELKDLGNIVKEWLDEQRDV